MIDVPLVFGLLGFLATSLQLTAVAFVSNPTWSHGYSPFMASFWGFVLFDPEVWLPFPQGYVVAQSLLLAACAAVLALFARYGRASVLANRAPAPAKRALPDTLLELLCLLLSRPLLFPLLRLSVNLLHCVQDPAIGGHVVLRPGWSHRQLVCWSPGHIVLLGLSVLLVPTTAWLLVQLSARSYRLSASDMPLHLRSWQFAPDAKQAERWARLLLVMRCLLAVASAFPASVVFARFTVPAQLFIVAALWMLVRQSNFFAIGCVRRMHKAFVFSAMCTHAFGTLSLLLVDAFGVLPVPLVLFIVAYITAFLIGADPRAGLLELSVLFASDGGKTLGDGTALADQRQASATTFSPDEASPAPIV